MGELLCNKVAKALEKGGIKCLGKRIIKIRESYDLINFLKAKKAFEKSTPMDIIFDSGYQNTPAYN